MTFQITVLNKIIPAIIQFISTDIAFMSCNHCPLPTRPSNILSSRPRIIPTYTHTLIFAPQQSQNFNVRCTPTFHSTAFDTEGYQSNGYQHQGKNLPQEKVTYLNETRQRRIAELNPNLQSAHFKAGQWYDPAKEQLFDSLKVCTARYSRERKLADLSSNPVFGGVYMDPYKISISPQQPATNQPYPHQVAVQTSEQEKICQQTKCEAAVQAPAPSSQLSPPQQQIPQPPRLQASGSAPNKKTTKTSNRPQSSQPVKRLQGNQKYKLSHEITLCNRGCSVGKKLAKVIALGHEPGFKVLRSK